MVWNLLNDFGLVVLVFFRDGSSLLVFFGVDGVHDRVTVRAEVMFVVRLLHLDARVIDSVKVFVYYFTVADYRIRNHYFQLFN